MHQTNLLSSHNHGLMLNFFFVRNKRYFVVIVVVLFVPWCTHLYNNKYNKIYNDIKKNIKLCYTTRHKYDNFKL